MNRKTNQLIETPMRMPKMRAAGCSDADAWTYGRSREARPGGGVARAGLNRRAAAGDDRLEVHARGKRAVLQAAVACEPRGAERVGDRRRAVAEEQRALQAQGHVFDDSAGAGLEGGRVRELVLEPPDAGVEARVRAFRLADLAEEHLERAR